LSNPLPNHNEGQTQRSGPTFRGSGADIPVGRFYGPT